MSYQANPCYMRCHEKHRIVIIQHQNNMNAFYLTIANISDILPPTKRVPISVPNLNKKNTLISYFCEKTCFMGTSYVSCHPSLNYVHCLTMLICAARKLTRPNSALDLHQRCASSICEHPICKVEIIITGMKSNYTQITNVIYNRKRNNFQVKHSKIYYQMCTNIGCTFSMCEQS